MEKIVAEELAIFLGTNYCMLDGSTFDDLDFDMDWYTEANAIDGYEKKAYALIATKSIREKLDINKLRDLMQGHFNDYKKWASIHLHIVTQDRNCPINFKNHIENMDKQDRYWNSLIVMNRFMRKQEEAN